MRIHARIVGRKKISEIGKKVFDLYIWDAYYKRAAKHAPLPQLDRGPDYESGRRRFESYRAHHLPLQDPPGSFLMPRHFRPLFGRSPRPPAACPCAKPTPVFTRFHLDFAGILQKAYRGAICSTKPLLSLPIPAAADASPCPQHVKSKIRTILKVRKHINR